MADEAWRRCQQLARQFTMSRSSKANDKETISSSATKWNGWGFADTRIQLDAHSGQVEITGPRYAHMFPADRILPKLRQWAEDKIGIDVKRTSKANASMPKLQPARGHPTFLAQMKAWEMECCTSDEARIRHSHGHTCKVYN